MMRATNLGAVEGGFGISHETQGEVWVRRVVADLCAAGLVVSI